MKLTLNGSTYTAKTMSLYEISMAEAIRVKQLTGMTITDWRLGLLTWDRLDPDVIRALVLVLKLRAGEQFHMDEINMLDAFALGKAVDWSDDLAEMQASLRQMLGQPAEDPPGCPATRKFSKNAKPRQCDLPAGHDGEHLSKPAKGRAVRTWAEATEQPEQVITES